MMYHFVIDHHKNFIGEGQTFRTDRLPPEIKDLDQYITRVTQAWASA